MHPQPAEQIARLSPRDHSGTNCGSTGRQNSSVPQDDQLLAKIRDGLEKMRSSGIIRVHHIRAMRNGRRIHVDGHVVIPEFWSVHKAHDEVEKFENSVVKELFLEGEMELHIDPCRRLYCAECEVADCPVRREAFKLRPPLSLEEMTSPVDRTDLS